jgi:hypothetical protein
LPEGIESEIAKSTEFLRQRSRKSGGKDASTKKAAVLAAQDLLWWWEQDAACTREGKWARLSAVLAGDWDLDLFDHMCASTHAPAPTLAKLRDAHGSILKVARHTKPFADDRLTRKSSKPKASQRNKPKASQRNMMESARASRRPRQQG